MRAHNLIPKSFLYPKEVLGEVWQKTRNSTTVRLFHAPLINTTQRDFEGLEPHEMAHWPEKVYGLAKQSGGFLGEFATSLRYRPDAPDMGCFVCGPYKVRVGNATLIEERLPEHYTISKLFGTWHNNLDALGLNDDAFQLHTRTFESDNDSWIYTSSQLANFNNRKQIYLACLVGAPNGFTQPYKRKHLGRELAYFLSPILSSGDIISYSGSTLVPLEGGSGRPLLDESHGSFSGTLVKPQLTGSGDLIQSSDSCYFNILYEVTEPHLTPNTLNNMIFPDDSRAPYSGSIDSIEHDHKDIKSWLQKLCGDKLIYGFGTDNVGVYCIEGARRLNVVYPCRVLTGSRQVTKLDGDDHSLGFENINYNIPGYLIACDNPLGLTNDDCNHYTTSWWLLYGYNVANSFYSNADKGEFGHDGHDTYLNNYYKVRIGGQPSVYGDFTMDIQSVKLCCYDVRYTSVSHSSLMELDDIKQTYNFKWDLNKLFVGNLFEAYTSPNLIRNGSDDYCKILYTTANEHGRINFGAMNPTMVAHPRINLNSINHDDIAHEEGDSRGNTHDRYMHDIVWPFIANNRYSTSNYLSRMRTDVYYIGEPPTKGPHCPELVDSESPQLLKFNTGWKDITQLNLRDIIVNGEFFEASPYLREHRSSKENVWVEFGHEGMPCYYYLHCPTTSYSSRGDRDNILIMMPNVCMTIDRWSELEAGVHNFIRIRPSEYDGYDELRGNRYPLPVHDASYCQLMVLDYLQVVKETDGSMSSVLLLSGIISDNCDDSILSVYKAELGKVMLADGGTGKFDLDAIEEVNKDNVKFNLTTTLQLEEYHWDASTGYTYGTIPDEYTSDGIKRVPYKRKADALGELVTNANGATRNNRSEECNCCQSSSSSDIVSSRHKFTNSLTSGLLAIALGASLSKGDDDEI